MLPGFMAGGGGIRKPTDQPTSDQPTSHQRPGSRNRDLNSVVFVFPFGLTETMSYSKGLLGKLVSPWGLVNLEIDFVWCELYPFSLVVPKDRIPFTHTPFSIFFDIPRIHALTHTCSNPQKKTKTSITALVFPAFLSQKLSPGPPVVPFLTPFLVWRVPLLK